MNAFCPVCKSNLLKTEAQGDRHFFECPRCGPFSLSGSAKEIIAFHVSKADDVATKVSYALYRMTKAEPWSMLTTHMLENIVRNTELPHPQEQLENLVVWLGERQPTMAKAIAINESAVSASGAADKDSVGFLVSQAVDAGFMAGNVQHTVGGNYFVSPIQLAMKGWELFEALKRGKASGRNAFMAMQFGNAELSSIVENHFKPAVKATGFDLRRLDDGQPAGLIDDRLRVEIRQSRFLIADLTHQNRGAYWEAGYAEGLGKPVIYTCRKDVFEDKTTGTHFDTNHHLTVVWEAGKLSEAAEKLKATIRTTLPEEAKLSD